MTETASGPRSRSRRWRGPAVRVLPALVAGLLILAGARALPGHAAGEPLSPDLAQAVPSKLVVTHTGHGYWLGFRSAVGNIGAGPLRISASRPGRSTGTMVADQVIEQRGAPMRVVRGVGRLRYVVYPDHRHWHYLGFERYELRRPGSHVALVRDRKTGFCLGDRYPVFGFTPPAPPRYTSRCGLGEPARLSITEGISVGYGDDYSANLEGQNLPLTGLAPARYVLVHTVNANRGLRELDYSNDSASLLIDLRWHSHSPLVRVLKTCEDTARCDARPARPPRVRTVATGLEIPWEIAFLPNRSALVTERRGRVRLLGTDGRLRRRPVARVPVSDLGEGGLLGLEVDPEFTRNRF